jgi:hypothetical protein
VQLEIYPVLVIVLIAGSKGNLVVGREMTPRIRVPDDEESAS